MLRKLLRGDKLAFLDELSATAAQCDTPSTRHEIFEKIKPFKGSAAGNKEIQFSRPTPRLLDEAGQPARGYEESQGILMHHFGDMEGSTFTTDETLRQSSRERFNSSLEQEHPELSLSCFPTRANWEKCMRRGKSGKAAGLDGLPNELFKCMPAEAAEMSYPLAVKMVVTCSEAHRYKGGLQVGLYKGRGAFSSCEAYRQILLQEALAKKYHSHVRSCLLREIGDKLRPLQCGARAS